MKKRAILICISVALAFQNVIFAEGRVSQSATPELSLFDSINVIRKFLSGTTQYNYADKNLTRVSLEYSESHPRNGFAYVYFFNNREVVMGGELTIYHYMDGKIFELTVGP